jgi:hypothetical protein
VAEPQHGDRAAAQVAGAEDALAGDAIASCTPCAVNGLGSPDPPRARESPVTCLVVSAITVMSREAMPTSSAVM